MAKCVLKWALNKSPIKANSSKSNIRMQPQALAALQLLNYRSYNPISKGKISV